MEGAACGWACAPFLGAQSSNPPLERRERGAQVAEKRGDEDLGVKEGKGWERRNNGGGEGVEVFEEERFLLCLPLGRLF